MLRYLLLPLHTAPLLLVLAFTAGQLLAVNAMFPMGLVLGLMLLSWLFKYAFALLDATVRGQEPPVLSLEMVNPLNEQRPLGQALLIAAGAALVYAAHRVGGLWLAAPLCALLLALLPASIAVLGLSGHLLRAASPPQLWSVVAGVGRDYLWLVGAPLGLATLEYELIRYDAPDWLAVAGMQLGVLWVFALIGGALHEHRLELDIEYRTDSERYAERAVRELAAQRSRALVHAYMKYRVNKPAQGWEEIQAWLSTHGNAADPADKLLTEHREVQRAALTWEDPRAGDRLTDQLVELYLQRRETGRALEVVAERLASNSRYRPADPAHAVRLAELATAAGKRGLRRQLMPEEPS